MSDKLEVLTYMPEQLGMVVDSEIDAFWKSLDLYINKALDLNRKEKNIRIAVDRIIYMMKHKYENVGLKFMVIDDNKAVGRALFLRESGDEFAINVLVDRVSGCDTAM
jgi:hypothetical protein